MPSVNSVKVQVYSLNKMEQNFKKLAAGYYRQDAVTLARKFIGKTLVRRFDDGTLQRFAITATEAYLGAEDKANHASRGRTPRTEIMYARGGFVYVYLIYGIHWLFNVVSGEQDHPQAVLICGLDNVIGSGRVGKLLQINKSFYGEDLLVCKRMWLEDSPSCPNIICKPRQGIDYAADEWKNKLWRFEKAGKNTRLST